MPLPILELTHPSSPGVLLQVVINEEEGVGYPFLKPERAASYAARLERPMRYSFPLSTFRGVAA